MNFINKILLESELLKEDKIINFKNPNYGNFIMLMGSPGAGKTFVVKNLLNLRSFKHLTGDNWIEIIANREKNIDLKNPDHTSEIANKIDAPFKKHREIFLTNQIKKERPENVVVDVTGRSIPNITSALNLVKNSNYKTTLIYVITSKEEAIKRNLNRKRVVPLDFLMSVYHDIEKTYTDVIQLFDSVYVKYNNDVWQPFKGHEKYIEINGNKFIMDRSGDYTREVDQILKVK